MSILNFIPEKKQTEQIESKPVPAPETEKQAAVSKQDTAPSDKKTEPDKKTGRSWVVQVASLSKRDSALALRNRLRKFGMTAFVVQSKPPRVQPFIAYESGH